METYSGIDTIAECQAAFRRDSVSEREAGRLLAAGRKLADELDRLEAQRAAAVIAVRKILES